MPQTVRKNISQSEYRDHPTKFDIMSQINKILISAEFQVSDRVKSFLSFIVQESVEGRGERIKAYNIAIEVLGRDSNFDLQNDPIVRIEAGRLRRALERYYLIAGRADPVLIEIPKGAYVPQFSWINRSCNTLPSPHSSVPVSGQESHFLLWAATALALAVAGTALTVSLSPAKLRQDAFAAAYSGDLPVLIVDPFLNLTGEAEMKELAAGVTEEIISQLAALQQFSIFQRAATPEQPRGIPDTQDPVGRNRKFVLEGSIRRSREVLRVNGRVLDSTSGKVVWSQAYDCDLPIRDSFKAEAAIALKIASAVNRSGSVLLAAGSNTANAPAAIEGRAACL
jgi:adenylate cyclase